MKANNMCSQNNRNSRKCKEFYINDYEKNSLLHVARGDFQGTIPSQPIYSFGNKNLREMASKLVWADISKLVEWKYVSLQEPQKPNQSLRDTSASFTLCFFLSFNKETTLLSILY